MEITIPLETVAVVCGGVGLIGYLIHYSERRIKNYVDTANEKLYDNLYGTDSEINRRIDDEVNNIHVRIDTLEILDQGNKENIQLNG